MTEIIKNDIGRVITVDCQLDITSASVIKLRVLKPDLSIIEWSPDVYETTNMQYTTVDGDLDMLGTYKIRPYIEMGTFKGHGSAVTLEVTALF